MKASETKSAFCKDARGSQRAISGLFENMTYPIIRKFLFRIMFTVCPVIALRTAFRWVHPSVYMHCKSVKRLSLAIGTEYGRIFHKSLNIRNLKTAAFFHDVGKLYG